MTVERLGVVGAGTMGAGIAQLGCLGGFEVVLHDPDPLALASGADRLQAALAKGAGKGLWSPGGRCSGRRRARDRNLRRARRLRPGDRGGTRRPRAEARALRPARGDMRARGGSRHEYLVHPRDRDRRAGAGARAGLRHALLQPAAAHAAGRDHRGREHRRGHARRRNRGRARDGPRASPRRRRARLHRQPLQPAVRARIASHDGRARGEPRRDRPRDARCRRLPDGTVRADGPDRRRCQPEGRAVVLRPARGAALGAARDPGADGRRGPAGPQGRTRFLRVRGRAQGRRASSLQKPEDRPRPSSSAL